MPKITKIDTIRAELKRITSVSDQQDPVAPTMRVCWHFTRMKVIGQTQEETIDFDCLVEILKKIPTGAGEAHFWQVVNATDFDKLDEELDRKHEALRLLEHR